MKRLGKVFLGVLCMILLFAFSHASDNKISAPLEPVITKNKVTFKWTAVGTRTRGEPIDKKKVRYVVYVYQAEKINEKPPEEKDFDRLKTEKKLEVKSPIKETFCAIEFDPNKHTPGYYFLGVQTKLEDEVSVVSWSCSETCTEKKPQYVLYAPK